MEATLSDEFTRAIGKAFWVGATLALPMAAYGVSFVASNEAGIVGFVHLADFGVGLLAFGGICHVRG